MVTSKLFGRSRVQVKSLPLAVQKQLKRAFAETRCMDLYGGDAPTYLNVIASQLRDQRQRIASLERVIREANKVLKD